MTITRITVALLVCAAPSGVVGEVTDAAAGGFTVQHERLIAAERAATWHAAVNEVGTWWNGDHTVSGDAKRMRIDPRPLGCFCEHLGDNNGIVHLVVTSVSTDVMLRMTGGLGPLGLMGVNGNMTWEFFDDVAGTRVRFTYAVGGYRPGGLDELAGPVDYVVGEALERLQAHVEGE